MGAVGWRGGSGAGVRDVCVRVGVLVGGGVGFSVGEGMGVVAVCVPMPSCNATAIRNPQPQSAIFIRAPWHEII